MKLINAHLKNEKEFSARMIDGDVFYLNGWQYSYTNGCFVKKKIEGGCDFLSANLDVYPLMQKEIAGSSRDLKKDTQDAGLDTLVYDESWQVRKGVAIQGYGLDILVHDKSWQVRFAVAEQGYGLNILVNDPSSFVRHEVAKQGYGLDILVKDKCRIVRQEVVRQGYGLDILVHDESLQIRYLAKEKLESLKK